jgi:regulator of protease activity HflC (stomatin/prohibitin superfamily)
MATELERAESMLKEAEAEKKVLEDQIEADKMLAEEQVEAAEKVSEERLEAQQLSHELELAGLRDKLVPEMTKQITAQIRGELEDEAAEQKARGARMEEMKKNERELVCLLSPLSFHLCILPACGLPVLTLVVLFLYRRLRRALQRS